MDIHQTLGAVLGMAAAMLGDPAGQADDAKTAAQAAQAAAETAAASIVVNPVAVSGSTPSITGEANAIYICGEVSTLSFTPSNTGICVVRFTSGTTPTVLTVPNTVKFPAWFDATSLEASRVYEISVMDGVYAAVMSWE